MSKTETTAIQELFIEDLGRIVGGSYPADPSGPTGGAAGHAGPESQPPRVSTLATGEEGGCPGTHITTLALGEEGGGKPHIVPV
jgi:hypothetical protein